jgi:hypothetical protein
MKNQDDFTPLSSGRPKPIVTFTPVWISGKLYQPCFEDRYALLILRRDLQKKVSFKRAYEGWRLSGGKEEEEFGEGRAFLRWLRKHHLAIDWKKSDFTPHPYFSSLDSPTHDPNDEMAKGLSFAIRPIVVGERKVKLYLRDEDMLRLLSMPYGNEEDFLELVMRYVAQRFEWEKWRAPAPTFLDWMISQGKRPVFGQGQVGFLTSYVTG